MIDNFIKYASEGVRSFLIFIMSVYNSLVGIAAGMLGQNPAAWNSDGWAFVKNGNNIAHNFDGLSYLKWNFVLTALISNRILGLKISFACLLNFRLQSFLW